MTVEPFPIHPRPDEEQDLRRLEFLRDEGLELLHLFEKLPSAQQRKAIVALLRSLQEENID